MSLYRITRFVPGAAPDDIQAALLRAQMCAQEFEGLSWVRSYWDREREAVTCIFHAQSEGDLREHAQRARIPCDAIALVETIGPEDYAGLVSDLVPAADRA